MYLPLHAIWLAAEVLHKSVRELFPAQMHVATVHTLSGQHSELLLKCMRQLFTP